MIGTFAEHASTFLRITAVATAVVFSIPIFLAPLAWARVFGWTVDSRSDLALYFGRCLGAFGLLMSWGAWHVSSHVEIQRPYFWLLIGFASLMIVVHVVGAVQKVQPWTETAEIPFWAGMAILGLLFCPAA